MTLATVVLVVGVVWRVTRLVTRDTVFDPVRGWLFEHGGVVGELVGCPWCASFWIATATVLVANLVYGPYSILEVVGTVCLASAVAGYLDKEES
jgi:hypothetical protein